MSVRDTQSATVGGLQTADLLVALGQLGLDRDELCRAAGVDRRALDRPVQADSDGVIPRDSHGGRATPAGPVQRDARGNAGGAPGAGRRAAPGTTGGGPVG